MTTNAPRPSDRASQGVRHKHSTPPVPNQGPETPAKLTPELAAELIHQAGQRATLSRLVAHALVVAVMVQAYRDHRPTTREEDMALGDLQDTLLVITRMLTDTDTGENVTLDDLMAELGIADPDVSS